MPVSWTEQSLFCIIMMAVFLKTNYTSTLNDHNPNTPHHNNLKNCVSVVVDSILNLCSKIIPVISCGVCGG